MRAQQRVQLLALAALVASVSLAAGPAAADHHFMQIEQVIAGVDGDTTAQAIQLRMRSPFQNNMAAGRLRVVDANGQNPVLIINFGEAVTNGQTGDRVLITTAAFNSLTTPDTVPDFTMTNRIPDSYLAAGSLLFQSDGGITWWRLSWGGAGYTGSNAGNTANDADGNFGPPWTGPLPSDGVQALFFDGAATDLSTNNADDYELTAGAATFTNNLRMSFTIDEVGAPIEVPLTALAIQQGTRISGNRVSLEDDDELFLRVESEVQANGQDWVQLQVTGVSPELDPSRLDLSSIARVTIPGVTGRIWLRNFDTNRWVLLGAFNQPTSFTLKSFPNIANPGAYVRDSDGRMQVRIRYSNVTDTFEAFQDLVQLDITP